MIIFLEKCKKIFNSLPPQTEEVRGKGNETRDDDEWGAVPAFLRRSKLK